MLLNSQWITEKSKEKIKKIPREKGKWKHSDLKPRRHRKSSPKREVYNNTILPQETRKIPNKQPNFTPKATRQRRTNKTQS